MRYWPSRAEIAEHFGAAGDIVSELPWRVRAGRRADEVYAFAQAVPQWLRAVELLEGLTSPGLPDGLPAHVVYTAACDALDNAGRGVEAGRVAERAVGHLLATADPAVAAELLMRVGHYRGIEDPQAGKAVLARAIGLYESLPPRPGYLRAVAYYTATVRVSEDMADAATLLDRALAVVDQVERPYDNGDLFNRRAWICLYQGDSRRALQLMEQSWRLSAPAPDPRPRVCHAASYTDILLKLGRLTDAVEVAERADLAGWTRSGRPETHDTATLRSNVFDALTMLGETEAAARRVEAFTTGAPTRDTVALHLDQAILALLRGDLSGAEARWAELDAVIVSGGEMGYESERWRVELELWQHRPDRAVQRALRALQGLAHTVYSPLSGPLLALAMRACADLSEHRSTSVLPAGEPLAARLHQVHDDMWQDPFLPGPVRVTHEADRLAWDAEQARARGDATPEAWDHVAAGYERVGRPHLVAYGRWRQAEALLADPVRKRDAAPVLRDAARLAIGHAPLLRQIEDLATRARIDLTPRQAPPPAATAPFGLTGRELAVLRLLGQGRSNAQVGAELFISTKTASVHVSNILRKMQVPTRVAAATVAAQSGLLEEPDTNSTGTSPGLR